MTVAVAIALYNGERFIEDQLDCIRTQTIAPDRVIMCDDGSKDRTVEIVNTYIMKHGLEDKWCLVKNTCNLGYIKNFYSAMLLCKEDIIFLCDQDDIWKSDKIEKMLRVMEEQPNIDLLSCKNGIIDSNGDMIKSVMHKSSKETYGVAPVNVQDIMRAYRWPGMLMCIRNDFFQGIYESVCGYKIPHDLAFAICAADKNSFYEYDYVGAFHRRHDNNTAKEEHRISKLLDLDRKLEEIEETTSQFSNIREANLSLKKASNDLIEQKYNYLLARRMCLKDRDIRKLLSIYLKDYTHITRAASFLCDLWIILFGKY